MQINPGVPTIEKSLRDALVLAGGISKNNENKFSVLKWCRSARTDKGVSALGQVVALRLMHADGLLQRLQSHLPRKIKVLGLRYALCFMALSGVISCDSEKRVFFAQIRWGRGARINKGASPLSLVAAVPSCKLMGCCSDCRVTCPEKSMFSA
jgi:hypothetical protein